jgi:hypothetical protein
MSVSEKQEARWNNYKDEHKDVVKAIENTNLIAQKIAKFLAMHFPRY